MATSKPEENEVQSALREAVQGLLYTSESDEPFEVIFWPGDTKPLDAKGVRQRSGHKPHDPFEVVPLDDFFADLIEEKDWYGAEEKADVEQYRKLLAVIKSRLSNAKAYRIGRVNIDIYLVGQTPQGDWAGVKTAAVET